MNGFEDLEFDNILLRHCNAVYNQNPIDTWIKGCILPFPKKGDLGLAKNYWGITLTSIVAKIYNALLRNDNILRKNFENLLGNPPKITHTPITKIISKQLDIKLGPFTQEELDSVLRKIKNRKAAGLDEIPPEVWKTRQFDDILLRHGNALYNQNPIDGWRDASSPSLKRGDLGLAKNYRGITLTSIAAKIYNALLRNHIEPKIDNILRKNQNGFRRNRSTTSQILTIRRILEGVQAKNLQATLIFVDFTKAFDSIHRGKMEQILLVYGIPKETVAAITILYRNTKVKVRSPDGDTEYFDIVAGVLQEDTLALYHLSRLHT